MVSVISKYLDFVKCQKESIKNYMVCHGIITRKVSENKHVWRKYSRKVVPLTVQFCVGKTSSADADLYCNTACATIKLIGHRTILNSWWNAMEEALSRRLYLPVEIQGVPVEHILSQIIISIIKSQITIRLKICHRRAHMSPRCRILMVPD